MSSLLLLDAPGGTMIDVPSPHERPRYAQVADLLRARIAAGLLSAGAPLPSESALIEETGASRGTIREAIAQLRAEGLVVTQHGRGTYVRPLVPRRRLSGERYRSEASPDGPPSTSFTVDQGIAWSEYTLDRVFAEVPASEDVAALFGLPVRTPLLERRFTFRTLGLAQQMSVSSYPLDLVAGTPVADPANEPWPGGNIDQLRTLGIEVTGISEMVRARMPAADEAATLVIPSGVPVVTITRQTHAGERVVEVAEIVIPADRIELAYWIPLT